MSSRDYYYYYYYWAYVTIWSYRSTWSSCPCTSSLVSADEHFNRTQSGYQLEETASARSSQENMDLSAWDDTGMSPGAYWDASIRRGHGRETLRSLQIMIMMTGIRYKKLLTLYRHNNYVHSTQPGESPEQCQCILKNYIVTLLEIAA